MSFITYPSPTPVFPALTMGWSVRKMPTTATLQATSVQGIERRATRQAYPLWEFEVTFEVLREETQNNPVYAPTSPHTEFAQISGLFLACLGAYGEFYFEDLDDNSRSSVPIGGGNDVSTDFLVYTTYFSGAYTMAEPVGGIKSIDAVFFNGTPIGSGNYSIGSDKRAIHFLSPPASGVDITASYHFYFRCRFTEDKQDYEQFAKNLWEYKTCRFRSVKP